MKNILTTIVLSLFLVFGFTYQGNAMPFTGEIVSGGTITDTGNAGSLSEYKSTDDKNANLILGGKLSYPEDKYRIDFYGNYQDGNDQAYGGNVDLNRIFIIESDYIRFMHRLGHDNLNHMVATTKLSGQGATLYHTDFSPGDNYNITRSTWKSHARLNIPNVPGLVLTFDNKWDQRKGMEQARTMSKCSSCHVVGKSKTINEVTQEFNPAISYHFGIFDIEYKFSYREFVDKSEDMTNSYMAVQHPGKPPGGNADFDQRMQFGEGVLGYSSTPDSIKYSHKLKVKATVPNHTTNLGVVYSEAINNSSDGASALNGGVGEELSVDYYAVNGGWYWRINKAVALTAKGKYYKQDADDVFIDVNDQVMTSGPGAGMTYADFLGTDFDYTRDSAYDKEVYVGDIKSTWRLSKKIKLNFGYNIEYEDRKNAIHLHLVEDTTTHKFSIGSNFRPTKSVRVKAGYKYTYVQNPYVFKHALCPCAEDTDYAPGTYADTSWYSKYVYGMRTASSTNRPGQIHEMKIKSYWSLTNNLSTNAYARYKYAVNDDADINDWNQNMFNGGIGGIYAINSKSEVSFGYSFFYDRYAATFCSAYYHG